MDAFFPGQRWISNTESELGLGLVLEVSYNRVTILYLASDERRMYARDNAPLTRVVFSVGDTVESVDEVRLTVTEVLENEGVMTYVGITAEGESMKLEEVELNHRLQFNKPQDRLFIGQIDPNAWFTLRYDTWQHVNRHQQSPVKGLLGCRAALIPHQIFIAYEAANRVAPRIMLADEVGLGKTIEAGLILHHRLLNGLSQRVLIIVPESLLHQWLVEMLRRFNLRFSLFDEARCLGELGEDGVDFDDPQTASARDAGGNPFANEQLVLCSLEFFAHHPKRQRQALQAGWDMVVVDEAHHLAWSEHAPSAEYQFVEQLALTSPGLILLTATPEQLGKESHFARLRLLDPDRFYRFAVFLEEEQRFEPVATAAKSLLADQALTEDETAALAELVKDDNVSGLLKNLADAEKAAAAKAALIKILLDHHGTGRILFRNSRQTVQGFPARERHGYALVGQENVLDVQQDPRYAWLLAQLTTVDSPLHGQKALLICKLSDTAIALEQTLRNRAGIASALFHEGLSIIERDRAAAYFADPDSAARLLVCSEIGSEGRNFQFVHHLILWDLPDNPDLLQQRIGRLDRIGQQHVIQIHIPYLLDSAQAVLYRWYDEGMNAFRANCSAARGVADRLAGTLQNLLAAPDNSAVEGFISATQTLSRELATQLNNGRDVLLELNSFRKDEAMRQIGQLQAYEQDGGLWPYLETVFECYGVETEFHSPDCYIVRPGDHLRVAHFPYLDEDGVTVTVSRACALAREDLQFLSWEHPMVIAAMDLILSSETGNATVSVTKHRDLRPGQFLLECLFVAECSAPAALQIGRFMPATPIRILIDQQQHDLTETYTHQQLPDIGKAFDKQQIANFLSSQRQLLATLINHAETLAQMRLTQLLEVADKQMLATLSEEVKRLARLRKANPSIKAEEVEQLKDFTLLAHDCIQATQLRLDAVRFVIAS